MISLDELRSQHLPFQLKTSNGVVLVIGKKALKLENGDTQCVYKIRAGITTLYLREQSVLDSCELYVAPAAALSLFTEVKRLIDNDPELYAFAMNYFFNLENKAINNKEVFPVSYP